MVATSIPVGKIRPTKLWNCYFQYPNLLLRLNTYTSLQISYNTTTLAPTVTVCSMLASWTRRERLSNHVSVADVGGASGSREKNWNRTTNTNAMVRSKVYTVVQTFSLLHASAACQYSGAELQSLALPCVYLNFIGYRGKGRILMSHADGESMNIYCCAYWLTTTRYCGRNIIVLSS